MENSYEVRYWLEFSQSYKLSSQNTGNDMLGAYNNGGGWRGVLLAFETSSEGIIDVVYGIETLALPWVYIKMSANTCAWT